MRTNNPNPSLEERVESLEETLAAHIREHEVDPHLYDSRLPTYSTPGQLTWEDIKNRIVRFWYKY